MSRISQGIPAVELTGALDQTLRSIADLYKQAAERAITALLKRLTNRFSPNPQALGTGDIVYDSVIAAAIDLSDRRTSAIAALSRCVATKTGLSSSGPCR